MKRVIRIFVLSKSEQRVVLIIIFALIAGPFVAYERRTHQFPVRSITATAPKPSPSPPSPEE
jgi:hypothetical protein